MSLTEIFLKSKLRPWAYLTALGLSACASSVAAPTAPPVLEVGKPPVINSDMDAQLMYRILTAEIATQEKAYDIAYALMLEAAKSRHEDELYRRSIAIASEARAGNSALKAAQQWRQAMPESLEAMRQSLGLELVLQRDEDAAQTLNRLFKATPASELPALSTQVPGVLQRLKPAQRRLGLAASALSPYLDDPVRGAYAHTILGTLALQNNDTAQALAHVRLALKQQADHAAAATLAVAVLEQGQEEARALVLNYLRQPLASPQVQLFYVRHLLRSNQVAAAFDQLQSLTLQHPQEHEAWLLLGRLQLDRRLLADAQISTERATTGTPPEELTQRAWMQLAQIAQAQQQWSQAQAYLARITEPRDSLEWHYRRADLEAAQGHLDQALKLLQEWPATDDESKLQRTWRVVRLLRDHGAMAQAYERLEQAREVHPDDNDLLYTQAMVAERLSRYADMEKLLRLHMQRAPRDHQALNALGYSLADRGERLDEAKTLIQAALTLAPGDPFVSDSLGWVLFRQGKLEQSIAVLTQAWESRSDAEIAAHLGEVWWVMGQADKARQTWAQGLALDPENATLRQTLKRLQVEL